MITVYIGENFDARDKAVKSQIAKFTNTYGDMALDIIDVDTSELMNMIDSITTVPFLSNKRMVAIKYLSAKKELADKLQEIISRTPDSTDLIIIESRLDKRSAYSKLLKELADETKVYDNLDGHDLLDWIVEFARDNKAKISKTNIQYLIDRVGPNQQQLINELTKMALLDVEITKEVIDEMTVISPHSSVFAMLDNLMQGRVDLACKLYEEQRSLGVEPQAILGMIVWQLNIIAIAISADKSLTSDDIAKKFKINPFVMRKNINIANKIGKLKILEMLNKAINTDKNIKTYKNKPDNEVYALLLQISLILNGS
jgi:DNA polymerase III delta subunit